MSAQDGHLAKYGSREGEMTPAHNGSDEEAQLLQADELEYEEPEYEAADWSHHRHRRVEPPPVKRGFRFSGPEPPRVQKIRPWFPSFQLAPARLIDRMCAKGWQKILLFVLFVLVWLGVFAVPLTSALPLKDGRDNVVNLDCTDTFWFRKNQCGLDGVDCRPFSNVSFAFRCPANCASVKVLNPHAVGPLDVNYRPLVVGDGIYRGDSFICGSAIHAGLVSDATGGCGRVSLVGEQSNFTATTANGIASIAVDAPFPLTFSFSKTAISCGLDSRDVSLSISLLFTSALAIFMTAPWQFFPIFTGIFVHVSFVSDPPGASSHNLSVLPDHLSTFAGRFLPSAFCAVVLYAVYIRRTLDGLAAQFEKTLLWLGGFWFGALSNYTFDWIPIQRLTAHDIEQQPGAKVALVVILVILVFIVLQQAYYFWLEGRLLPKLALYAGLIAAILACLVIPGVQLRIHHYVLALLLLPGTSLQTRPSLLYQGILLGLFVNGIARWGFDSVLQTPDALRGDGAFESPIPSVSDMLVSAQPEQHSIGFDWTALTSGGLGGLSVLVNDVERARDIFADTSGHVFEYVQKSEDVHKAYIRFAYIEDGVALDYSKAGTLFANGTWVA